MNHRVRVQHSLLHFIAKYVGTKIDIRAIFIKISERTMELVLVRWLVFLKVKFIRMPVYNVHMFTAVSD